MMTQDRICIFRAEGAVSICGKPATVIAELELTDFPMIYIADDIRRQSAPLCSSHAALLRKGASAMTDPAIPTDPADRPDPVSPPDTIHVTIDPSRLYAGYNSTLSDLILEACATKVMESFRHDEAVTDLRRRVTAIRDEEIRAHLAPVVADAIAASLQPTDAFGQAKGEPKTLREVILEQAMDFLRKPADGSGYNDRRTYVQALIQKEVGRAVEAEMRKALDEGRTQIHDALKAKGAEMLEKALVELAQKGVSA